MKIRYVTGNLLEASERYILHGCNAHGVIGKGVAKLIRDKDPDVYHDYRRMYEQQGNYLYLGQIVWVPGSTHYYINGITQKDYASKAGEDPNRVYADYDAIRKVIRGIDLRAWVFGDIESVAMPLIGAGLAQGSWTKIAAIIEEEAEHFEPVVYLLDGKIPTT
jgi:O-acetyl-ADP-ribose deacetylase (regulator of RNase III)